MANVKLSAKTELTSVATGDFLPINDVSDTTDGSNGTSKKITVANLTALKASSGANSDITSLTGLTTPLTVAQGGTGAATLTGIVKGAGTSAMTAVTAPTGTIVGTSDSQTLTNKTLTAPIISTISNTGTLTLPTSTDTLVGKATTDTLTNKTLTAPVIATITNSGTLTLPTSSDTLVGRATTDTLTNKTLTKPVLNGTTPAITSDADGATITFDCSASDNHMVTLGGNRTLAVSNFAVGQKITLELIQDGTGTRTVTWFNASSATMTMTIANPCVVTSGLDIPTTTPIIFTTTGALPTGVVSGTTYYWIRVSSTTGNLATSIANAQAGTTVTTSGSQSGTHTGAVQIRWTTGGTAPTLTTGKYRKDVFGIWQTAANVYEGFIIGQNG